MNNHHRPRFTFSTAEVIAYGRTLLSDRDFNEILDALSVDALRALATVEDGGDPAPQLHLMYKRDDGRIQHQAAVAPAPSVDVKYEFFTLVGHSLGSTAEHRLAAAYLMSTAWVSSRPGTLPEHAADRREAIIVSGLAFDCLRHNLYTAHFQRDERGRPRVTSEKTLHYGAEDSGAGNWTANKLLLSLVRGYAKGVLERASASAGTLH